MKEALNHSGLEECSPTTRPSDSLAQGFGQRFWSDALVFDSGMGGLSVVSEIRRQIPALRLDYVCDNAALPYGTKVHDWLVERILTVCAAACERSRPRALVIACNTASTLALDALRARLNVPVVGTVPAIKPAATLSDTRHMAILATRATLESDYLTRLIAQHAPRCQVHRLPADALVMQAERLLSGHSLDLQVLQASVAPLWQRREIDSVVLGCTHFPLLRGPLMEAAPPGLHWIDSSAAIARQLARVLARAPATPPEEKPEKASSPSGRSFATLNDSSGLAIALRGYGFTPPEALTLNATADIPCSR